MFSGQIPTQRVGRTQGRETRNRHPVVLAAARCGDGQRPLGIQERILGGRVWFKVCHFWCSGAGSTRGEIDDGC